MKEHEIKEVCKFMGYEWIDKLHVKNERGDWVVDGNLYDPSDDHKQFAEIWNNLTEFQRHQVICSFKTYYLAFNECLNDLPAVMSVVLEIVKGEER